MREILFRGKRTDNGKWVTGAPFVAADRCKIIQAVALHPDFVDEGNVYYSEGFPVDPETIGQYTGLTDKNGKKIFEGDIFSIEDEIVAVVIFKDGCFRMEEYGLCGTWTESGFDECGGGWGVIQCDPIDWYAIIDMEVIGNIHDNPELLGGGNDG